MRGRAYTFRGELVDYPGVVRTVALREDQTLEELHELFREGFGWDDPHLYSFWLSGRFWDGHERSTPRRSSSRRAARRARARRSAASASRKGN